MDALKKKRAEKINAALELPMRAMAMVATARVPHPIKAFSQWADARILSPTDLSDQFALAFPVSASKRARPECQLLSLP